MHSVTTLKAEIGMVDRIFTRIQARETATAGLSAFMMDLNQVTDSVKNATSDSLVIWDEFGKGTGKTDGMALLVAVIEEMLLRNDDCPMVIVSTHFHEILSLAILPDTRVLSYRQMESIIDGDELICLYQLVEADDLTSSSQARFVMAAAGLPVDLIQRADEVTDALLHGQCIKRIQTDASQHELEVAEAFSNALLAVVRLLSL
jgi:DNA mismatch repair protein MSH5